MRITQGGGTPTTTAGMADYYQRDPMAPGTA